MCNWINRTGAEDEAEDSKKYEMEIGIVSSFGFLNGTTRHHRLISLLKILKKNSLSSGPSSDYCR